MKKLTTEEWVAKVLEKFPNNARDFDYSKSTYVDAKTKVCIICKKCGQEFWQTPDAHSRGQGCSKCRNLVNVKTTEQFIQDAVKVHGNKYDYSKVNYINNQTKVCIVCPMHGEFYQSPNAHLSGSGCRKCAKNYNPSTEEWIAMARLIHGNKYDYSKVEYKNCKSKVKIICPVHGEFEQLANNHISMKQGCLECSYSNYTKTKEDFISQLEDIYKDKFDCSNIDYVNAHTKVKIKCNECGRFFKKTPAALLKGYSCPYCKTSSVGEELITSCLTENNINFEREKSFPTLKDKMPLRFDFWLPDKNTVIEFQGRQHYEWPNSFHKTTDEFLDACARDNIKRQWCSENNIQEIEISYNEIKNTKSIIKLIIEKEIK